MTDPLRKIAFVGRMMDGKTTARRLLEAEGYHGLAFADRVKTDCVRMLNELEQQYRAEFLEYEPITLTRAVIDADKAAFRTLLQWLGTEYFREYRKRPTHWIDMLGARIERETRAGAERFVVDDARFENEIDALKAWGFTIIRVRTPDTIWMTRMLAKYGTRGDVAEKMDHGSEALAGLLPADLTVWNDGDEDVLRSVLLDVVGLR